MSSSYIKGIQAQYRSIQQFFHNFDLRFIHTQIYNKLEEPPGIESKLPWKSPSSLVIDLLPTNVNTSERQE